MNTHDSCGVFIHGILTIARMSLIRRTDLDHFSPRGRHDVGDAERPPNFDQFASGDNHFLAGRQRIQSQNDASRVIVHDDGILGTCDEFQ